MATQQVQVNQRDQATRMSDMDIMVREKTWSGTSPTGNSSFDKNGYLKVENLWDPEELYHPVPKERGQMNYMGSVEKYRHVPQETQVPGSLARYFHPQYKKIHCGVRKKLENIIGSKLYNTYYYDRFYFEGQELYRHVDRPACEISVTIHVSSNIKEDWPVKIKTPDTYTDKTKSSILVPGEDRSCILKPGDGMIYKGCERPHWRDPMPVDKKKKKLFGKSPAESYYHQIFFHYVLAYGERAQHAWDQAVN